eukprot:Gregarina_sp_Poly_1__11248@NODE_92_length_14764_cov_231_259032_g79_i0_p2_GENE_NODE_92_length_14764_cov_231_259032_g79_i0NODE_92_length_14764_cov_231_259032_g79_i0_p2_ORF_typecomplete_len661_score76_15Lipase_3/PF01764_25/1_4e15DUF2974/PF11187_8/1_4e03DUF2974/PF11187_8/0_12Hydrolase_4/PF12146_8/0_13DUF676/PF05057_14/0_29_NODE_92_length_14764_cov_231_259032_g79_i023814363
MRANRNSKAKLGLAIGCAALWVTPVAGDAFLQSLREVSEVYLGIPNIKFENSPPHPGCSDPMGYMASVLGLPESALDMNSMMSILKPCPPGPSVNSNPLMLDFEEVPRMKQHIVDEFSSILAASIEETKKEFVPVSELDHVKSKYMGVDRGLSVLRKTVKRMGESEVIGPIWRRFLVDQGVVPASPDLGRAVDMVNLCITNIPDVLIGLLASKTVSNMLVNLIQDFYVIDSFMDLMIYGNFFENNLGEVLCGGIDFAIDGNDFDPQWVVCGLANALGSLLSCGGSATDCTTVSPDPPLIGPQCEKTFPNGTSPHTHIIDLTLQPTEYFLETDGSVNTTNRDIEGYIYMYDFRATNFMAMFTTQAGCDIPRATDQFIPGWTREAEIFLNQAGAAWHDQQQKDYLAFASVSRKQGGACSWHINQRGTFNEYEWVVNFQAETIPAPYFAEGYNLGWHRGYASIASVVTPMFDDYFSRYIGEGKECSYGESTIHLAGHSLGGGMVEVYLLHLAHVWATRGVRLEAVTFAPAHGLNDDSTRYIAGKVNIRSVVNVLDMVPRFPCANRHGLPRCPQKYFTFNGDGWDTPFGGHLNELVISVDDLRALNATKFAHFQLSVHGNSGGIEIRETPSHLDLAEQHTEAYHCYFVRNYCSDDESTVESACQ